MVKATVIQHVEAFGRNLRLQGPQHSPQGLLTSCTFCFRGELKPEFSPFLCPGQGLGHPF